eukprot:863305-Pyramimonas_sp.AAC.1
MREEMLEPDVISSAMLGVARPCLASLPLPRGGQSCPSGPKTAPIVSRMDPLDRPKKFHVLCE